MGRFWLGIGILVVFLVLGLGISSAMDDVHLAIADTLDAAAEQALSGAAYFEVWDYGYTKFDVNGRQKRPGRKIGTALPPWQIMPLWTRSTVFWPSWNASAGRICREILPPAAPGSLCWCGQ